MKGKYQWVKPKVMLNEETISTNEAAKMLGVSLSTVQRYSDLDLLGAKTNPITGRRSVYKESVQDMMQAFGMDKCDRCNLPMNEHDDGECPKRIRED